MSSRHDFCLCALDYLGFGLPILYPRCGRFAPIRAIGGFAMGELPLLGPRPPGMAKAAPATRPDHSTDGALHSAAQALEARFLSEMLRAAGLGETPAAFGGGIGEDQFASFLRDEQAEAIARRGGIGLAESIFAAMKRGPSDGA